jgi:hypothetical protein
VGAIAAMGAMYQLSGNQGFSDAMEQMLVRPATGTAYLIRNLEKPVAKLAINVASGSLRTMLNGTGAVMSSAVNFSALADDLTCVGNIKQSLPNTTVIKGVLASTETALGRVDAALVRTYGQINDVVATKNAMNDTLSAIDVSLLNISTAVARVVSTLDNTSATSAEASTQVDYLVGPGSGIITQVVARFGTLTANVPARAATDQAAVDVTTLRNNGMSGTGGTSARAGLISALTSVQTGLQAIGNQSTTADKLDEYNLAIAAIKGNQTFPRLAGAIRTTVDASSRIPSVASISESVGRLSNLTAQLEFSGFRQTLADVQSAINSIPSFDTLIAEIERVRNVTSVYPCLDRLAAAVRSLNATVFQLPPTFSFVDEIVASVKAAVEPAISSIGNTTATIRQAENSTKNIDVLAFNSSITALEEQLRNSSGAVNTTGLLAEVGSVNSAAQIDASLLTDLDTFDSKLLPANATLIASLRDFEAIRSSTILLLTAQLTLIDHYHQGYCSNNLALCSSSSDCSGGATCTAIGERRCLAAQSTPCASCPGGDRCNLVDPELDGLAAGLSAIGSSTPDTSATSSQLNSATSSSGFDLGGLSSDIAAIRSSTSALPIASTREQLRGVSEQLNGNFDVGSINGTITTARTQLQSTDFSSFDAQISSIDSTVSSSLDPQLPQLHSFRSFALSFDNLLVSIIPAAVQTLQKQNLESIQSSSGLYGLLTTVTGVLDGVVAGLGNSSADASANATSLIPAISLNTTSSVASLRPTFDTVGDDDALAAGSLYFLASVLPGEPLGAILPHTSPLAARVYVDRSGSAYPGKQLCLTDACLRAEANAINRENVDVAANGIDGAPSLPSLPLSRELAFLLPVAVPALIALAGIFAVLGPCCCTSSRFQRCPPACFACCAFAWVPCLALFAVIFLPVLLVYSDVCFSLDGLVVNAANPEGVCALAGGVQSGASCEISTALPIGTAPSNTLRLDLDIRQLTTSIMTGCASGSDPVAAVFNDAGQQLGAIMENVTTTLVDDALGSTLSLRPQMRAVVQDTAAQLPQAITETFGSLATVASCTALNSVIDSIVEPLCCDLYTAVFWLIMPWAILPVILCTCGCTCALLARKRLPTRPWGPFWEQDIASAGLDADKDAGTGADAVGPPRIRHTGTSANGPKLALASVSADFGAAAAQDFEVTAPQAAATKRRVKLTK